MTVKLPSLFTIVTVALSMQTFAESKYPKFYDSGDKGFREAFVEEAKADFSISYENDGSLDIGVERVQNGVHYPLSHSLEELESFWKGQRHKRFILVTLSKSTRTDQERAEIVQRLTQYFFNVGFRRVRIHQGLAEGVGVLSDSLNTAARKRRQ